MQRIIIHWTAGTNEPNNHEYECYHYLVNGNGLIVEGKHKPEDNENCNDGNYAMHTGGGNTGSIGVAMCGMFGYTSPKNIGKYPITRKQAEATFRLVAQLCRKYGIPITSQTVITHYEFGQTHSKTTSYGKIDITCLPYAPELRKHDIGNYIRNKVRWYFERLQ